eukprot:1604842-Rhodomonas_salina.1
MPIYIVMSAKRGGGSYVKQTSDADVEIIESVEVVGEQREKPAGALQETEHDAMIAYYSGGHLGPGCLRVEGVRSDPDGVLLPFLRLFLRLRLRRGCPDPRPKSRRHHQRPEGISERSVSAGHPVEHAGSEGGDRGGRPATKLSKRTATETCSSVQFTITM